MLSCVNGACRAEASSNESKDINVQFDIKERRLTADGRDKTPIFLIATTGSKNKPFTDRLVIYPSPSTAGTVRAIVDEGDLPDPGRFVELKFDEDGASTAEYIACDRAGSGQHNCPEFIFLNIARPTTNQKFEPIARSPVLKLLDNTVTMDKTLDTELCDMPGVHVVVHTGGDAEEDISIEAKPELLTEKGELSLIGPGINITLRMDLSSGKSGVTNVSRLDVALKAGESLMLPSPCNETGALLWSGFFDVKTLDLVGQAVKELRASFELACSGKNGQTATVRGCMLIENEIAPEPDAAENMGGSSGMSGG